MDRRQHLHLKMAIFSNSAGAILINSTGHVVDCTTCPCGAEGCGICTEPTTAFEWDVELSGFADVLDPVTNCTNCTTLNDTYRLVHNVTSTECFWEWNGDVGPNCNFAAGLENIKLSIVGSSGDILMRVALTGPFQFVHFYSQTLVVGSTTSISCGALASTFAPAFEVDGEERCNLDGTICQVTRITL